MVSKRLYYLSFFNKATFKDTSKEKRLEIGSARSFRVNLVSLTKTIVPFQELKEAVETDCILYQDVH